ncbi:MAG: GNAT family N-acetyltransferase [Dehalococcoidales bacterium]|nr:GNAT family N-acetyltransferase [Dehalococcoidales bacterium]
MKIKKATSQDLPAILEVMRFGSNVDHTDFIKQSVRAGKCLVTSVADKVTGFGIIGNSLLFYNHEFIELLIVHPEYRRRGIATALIKRMESICKTPKLFTSTNQTNIPAQKTYEASGFIRSGYIENLDEGDPEIIYFKRLEGADRGGEK